ncbi:hypothetical protein N5A93_08905 [Roseovarius sp. EGI FJ00037]|uniref:hypothetical protein n=1 Tax=Roseovarius salincola TaxID=2978479 RepID=UPI0022A83ADB|nr:hypothetical protein [Roseovarius sp. EGI FJ00037]MCZ0812346.1 hypothetical protein [Roseovarius sp. EGI FJ00037]
MTSTYSKEHDGFPTTALMLSMRARPIAGIVGHAAESEAQIEYQLQAALPAFGILRLIFPLSCPF